MRFLANLTYIGSAVKRFFSTSAYFVNGDTLLMSDLTYNLFYPSAERIWLNMVEYTLEQRDCDRLTEDADFGKRNHLFR